MRILITGGAGFIGSHLTDRLLEEGHQVTILDNLSTGRLKNLDTHANNPNLTKIIADIRNYDVIYKAVEACDHVYHLAAAVGVKLIMEYPVETININIMGTENILKAAMKLKKKFFLASTSEVYGKTLEIKDNLNSLKEEYDILIGPTTKRRWAYACTKAIDEFLAMAYYEEKQLPLVIGRFFNTVGPRQAANYGMVIPNFIKRALLNEPITLFGDGSQTRSFTLVNDAVESMTRLMNCEQALGQVFNIGKSEEISIKELAQKICQMTGSSSKIVEVPMDQVYGKGFEDMKHRNPNVDKLKQYIDYTPHHTIDQILKITIDYIRAND